MASRLLFIVQQFCAIPVVIAAGLALCLISVADEVPADRSATVTVDDLAFFESRIRPVLVQHCYECHAADSKIVRGGLLLDTRDALLKGGDSGPGLVAGQPENSLLMQALYYDSLQMPPAGKLPETVIADFKEWIQRGAHDPRSEVRQAKLQPVTGPFSH
jgi:hypothetical protein